MNEGEAVGLLDKIAEAGNALKDQIIEKENENEKEDAGEEAPVSSAVPSKWAIPSGLPVPSAPAAAVPCDAEVLRQLMTEVGTVASPKYVQFQVMVEKMAALPGMTPLAKYQAAAVAVSITTEEISEATEAMLARVTQEEVDYAQWAASEKSQANIDRDATSALKAKIEENKQRIREIESENQKNESQISQIEAKATQRLADIDAGVATFKATAAHAREQLQATRQEAAQYLKA
jgi:hypothetical protein